MVNLAELTDEQWFARLNYRRTTNAGTAAAWWKYYDNEQPLAYLARILLEQEDRFPPLHVAWSQLVVDCVEERLDVEGFRLAGLDSSHDALEGVWQANDLDEASSEAHLTSLVTGQAYAMVGPTDEATGLDSAFRPTSGGYPLITVEYPDQVAVEVDDRTRRVIAALKVWRSDPQSGVEDRALLYRPGRMVGFASDQKVTEAAQPWARELEAQQTSPLVPVVPLLNRPRRGCGLTELTALKPLVDGVNQTATNMLAGIEHHAVPRKWAVGVSSKDFVDQKGKELPPWRVALGAVWAVPGRIAERGEQQQQVNVGQFPASDLRNFHESIRQLAQLASSVYGLPPHYLGYTSENPASAEAIRSSEARLVKRAERRQRTFGGGWERVMRLAWVVMGMDPAAADRLATVWREPATPTRASMVDAAAKALDSGLVDVEQARIDAGYSQSERDAMRQREAADRAGALAAALGRGGAGLEGELVRGTERQLERGVGRPNGRVPVS